MHAQCWFNRGSPVIVDDEWDSLKQDCILCIRMLHLFRFWWFLCFIENCFQTLNQAAFDSTIFWWRVTLQQAQQFARKPGSWNKVVCVILKIGWGWGHDLENWGGEFFFSIFVYTVKHLLCRGIHKYHIRCKDEKHKTIFQILMKQRFGHSKSHITKSKTAKNRDTETSL